MSSTTMAPPDAVSAALDAVEAAVESLMSAEFWQMAGRAEADALARAERLSRLFDYGKLLLLADFHSRDIAGQLAGLSTQKFLRARLRISPAEASRRVHAVRELAPSVSPSGETVEPELPATAAGVASGELSDEHAQVISAAIRRLPTGLDSVTRTAAEVTLASHARDLDPADLKAVARRLHLHLNHGDTLPDDKPSRNELSFRRDIDGTDLIRGGLDPESSATVQAALAPLMQPRPAEDGVRDPRSPARRRADALVTLSEQALRQGDLPTMGGERPHVTVTTTLADLQAGTGYATLNTGTAISAGAARRIACDASITPIVLGNDSEPLDIGRATRTIPPASDEPSYNETSAAYIPTATNPPNTAKFTTYNTGPTEAGPPSAILSSHVPDTTGPSITKVGRSPSETADHTSFHHHSSTRCRDHDATPGTTS